MRRAVMSDQSPETGAGRLFKLIAQLEVEDERA